MTEFYIYSLSTRLFVTFMIGILVLFQTFSIVIFFYRYILNRMNFNKFGLEVSVLVVAIIYALLQGLAVSGYYSGLIVFGGYEFIRLAIYIVIVYFAGIITIKDKKMTSLDIILSTLIILPVVEELLGKLYPALFLTSLAYLIIRSIVNSINSIDSIRNNISSLSIMNAIDSLETAVLFSDSNGQILLVNNKMRKLMLDITNKTYRDSKQFYIDITENDYSNKLEKLELEGQVVFLLPDNSAWMFSKAEIQFRFKNYIQITATNVSKLWKLTDQLQKRKFKLMEKSDNLKETIANLHILSKEKELEKARINAHDVLGQKLSLILRTIQNQQDLDYDVLNKLSKNILSELKSDSLEKEPEEEIVSIQKIYSTIGVKVNFEGQLPKMDKYSRLFVDIIREGCTNAVRHGFATEINIESVRDNKADILTISNKGFVAKEPINRGSGLNNIKDKVSSLGGMVEIMTVPKFTLTIVIPRGDEDV